MNDFVKIELAREIMNFMIGRHGQKGYDKSNKMLMQLLEDEKAMKKNDMVRWKKSLGYMGLWLEGRARLQFKPFHATFVML